MTIIEARARLEEEMRHAEEMLSGIDGVICEARVEETSHTDDNGEESVAFLFGAVMLCAEGAQDKDKMYLSVNTEIDIDGNVDEDKLDVEASALRARLAPMRERLIAAEDKAAEIEAIGKEIDAELDERYRAEVERLNASTKNNLKVAIMGCAVMAIIALVCILIERLVG